MRFITSVIVVACICATGSDANAVVGWCFPFPWGAGYRPMPTYGAYYGGCCPAPCAVACSPCGTSCCPSACGTSCGDACGASISSDKVPAPVDDPGFRERDERDDRQPRDETSPEREWRGYERDRDNDATTDAPAEPARRPRPDFLDRDRNRLDSDTDEFDRSGDSPIGDDADDRFRRNDLDDFSDPGTLEDADEFGRGDDMGESSINFGTRKPPQEAPVDDLGSPVDEDSDVVLPSPDAPEQSRLFRGILSESQARTEAAEDLSSVLRLAGADRQRRMRTVRWSAKDSRRQQPPRWIAAPPRDGRVRL